MKKPSSGGWRGQTFAALKLESCSWHQVAETWSCRVLCPKASAGSAVSRWNPADSFFVCCGAGKIYVLRFLVTKMMKKAAHPHGE